MLANIPTQLREIPNWVVYKDLDVSLKEGPQKIIQVNLSPKTLKNSSVSDPETWGTLDDAIIHVENEAAKGIAYQFNHNDDVSAIKLNKCFDADGKIFPKAKEIIDSFESYTELSPDGNSVHIFFYGTIKGIHRKSYASLFEFGVELLSHSCQIITTGAPLHGYEHRRELEDLQNEYKSLFDTLRLEDQNQSVPNYIDEFNSKHAVIRIEGKTVIMNEEVDAITGYPKITFSTPTDFKAFYQNKKELIEVEGKNKLIYLANAWLQHADRRQYEAIVFNPPKGE